MSNDDPNHSDYQNNPYRPNLNGVVAPTDGLQLPEGQGRGMVTQASVLGVLMIIQGVLNCLAGVGVGIYAALMPAVFTEMQAEMAKQAAKNGGAAPPPAMPENFAMYIGIGGGLFAVALLLIGALMIYGGFGVMKYERRGLAIGALCGGMLTIVTCYCFPTSLALAVYGLVFLLNQPVALAFQLRSQGYSPQDIQRAFLMRD